MCDQDELQDQPVGVTAAEPLATPSDDVEGAEDEPSGQIPAFLAQNQMAATHAAETPDESAGETFATPQTPMAVSPGPPSPPSPKARRPSRHPVPAACSPRALRA